MTTETATSSDLDAAVAPIELDADEQELVALDLDAVLPTLDGDRQDR